MTLTQLRQLALIRSGTSTVNGLPFLPDGEGACPRCLRPIKEHDELTVGIVGRAFSVGHLVCPPPGGEPPVSPGQRSG